jgi:hypothetical protein
MEVEVRKTALVLASRMAKQKSMSESEINQQEVKTEVLTSRGGGVIRA